MRKLSIMCLLFTGLSMVGGEPMTSAAEGLSFRGSNAEHSIIKVKSKLLSGSSYMREEDRESHGPGFFANLSMVMPSEGYMDPYYTFIYHNKSAFKTGVAIEAGNYFRFFHTDKLGVGLRAVWLQAGYNAHEDTSYWDGNAFGSILRVGPQASYLIGEHVGIDAFYTIGAQYNITWFDGENISMAGLSHEAGAAVRFMIFTGGFAVKFGNLPNVDTSDPKTMPIEEKYNFSVSSMRIFLGIQL
jgi:hypothetical protein